MTLLRGLCLLFLCLSMWGHFVIAVAYAKIAHSPYRRLVRPPSFRYALWSFLDLIAIVALGLTFLLGRV